MSRSRRLTPSVPGLESRLAPSDGIAPIGGAIIGPGPGTIATTPPEWGEGGAEGYWGPTRPAPGPEMEDELQRIMDAATERLFQLPPLDGPGPVPEWGEGGAEGTWAPEPSDATTDPVPPEAPPR